MRTIKESEIAKEGRMTKKKLIAFLEKRKIDTNVDDIVYKHFDGILMCCLIDGEYHHCMVFKNEKKIGEFMSQAGAAKSWIGFSLIEGGE